MKSAVKFVNNYEKTAAKVALRKGYDYVVCGHIHQPKIQVVRDKKGRKVTYLNSEDWVENLSALEYNKGRWMIYKYYDDLHLRIYDNLEKVEDPGLIKIEEPNSAISDKMVKEFKFRA